jgi:hypothetical protein
MSCQTARCHIPENSNVYIYCCEIFNITFLHVFSFPSYRWNELSICITLQLQPISKWTWDWLLLLPVQSNYQYSKATQCMAGLMCVGYSTEVLEQASLQKPHTIDTMRPDCASQWLRLAGHTNSFWWPPKGFLRKQLEVPEFPGEKPALAACLFSSCLLLISTEMLSTLNELYICASLLQF